MPNNDEYKKVVTEIVQKQMVILGPDIALMKARNVSGLSIDANGKVLSITGGGKEVLQSVINEYVALSGEIVRKALEPLLEKYPALAAESLAGGNHAIAS